MINVHSEIRKLRNENLIDENSNLTPLGIEILTEIVNYKKDTILKKSVDVTDDYVEKYVNLFPKKRLPSGKQARADVKNLKNNFMWFFKNYNYDWPTVLKATALYVDEYERKNFMFMRTSQYFISKMNPDKTRESELANYCSLIVKGEDQEDTAHFSEKVV